MEISDIFNISFKTGNRSVKELICPRCVKYPITDNVSTTDGATKICADCAKSEQSYSRAKDKGASDYVLGFWGYEQEKWPVH